MYFTVDDRRGRLRRHVDRKRLMPKITEGRAPPSHILASSELTRPSIELLYVTRDHARERGETATRALRSSKVERVVLTRPSGGPKSLDAALMVAARGRLRRKAQQKIGLSGRLGGGGGELSIW
jgi:hypothetical protein